MTVSGLVVAGLTTAVLVLLVVIARSRAGRAPGVPEVLTEPPEDIHPAELAVLWGSFRRSSPLLAAVGVFDPWTQRALYQTELLHLAHEGVLELQAIGPVSEPKDLQVSLRKGPSAIDEGFVDFLFGGAASPRTLREVAVGADRGAFAGWAGGLRTKVLMEMFSTQMRGGGMPGSISGMFGWALRTFMPLSRQTRGWTQAPAFVASLAGAIASLAIGRLAPPWSLVIPPLLIVGGLVAVRLMPYRPPHAFRERLARWAAFRRFLVSHAEMDDAPALAVTVWERYLVYASALQAAEEVEGQVHRVIPRSMMLIPWLGPGGGAWIRSIGSTAPAPVRVPKSAGPMP